MRRRDTQESLFHTLSNRTKVTAQKYKETLKSHMFTHDIFRIFIDIHCVTTMCATTVSVTNIINLLMAGFKFTAQQICSILILISVKSGHNYTDIT